MILARANCAKSLCKKKVFAVFKSAIFLTVGHYGTYSVAMWEKVENSGFFEFAAAKSDGERDSRVECFCHRSVLEV